MKSISTLFQREFFGYFRTPVAYVFLVVFLVATVGLAWFLGRFFDGGEATLARFFVFLPWVFLFLVPAVGMRLWAEEKRSGTWELLFTLPVSIPEAVLGKFLAGWLFLCVALLGTLTMAFTVGYLGSPDWGVVMSGYAGAILMSGAYLSICSLTSALSRSQVISFVISVVSCLVLVFLGWSVFNNFLTAIHLPVEAVDAISNFSFITHFEPMTIGLIRFQDLAFFLTIMGACLSLNIIILKR